VPIWSAEVAVDEGLARRLLGQFPELRLESLRPLAEGWDNAVWVVDERYAFRFPRRQIAIPGVELELALLPKLAPLLPLPIPDPIFQGRPAEGYPWPFFGSELLPGRETCDAKLDDESRLDIALQLASSTASGSGGRHRMSSASSRPRRGFRRPSYRPSSTATCTSATCSCRLGA
jgi:aminoglycoside phosphotransferase (APT) family kinase protein